MMSKKFAIERSEIYGELLAFIPPKHLNINLSIGGTKILTGIINENRKILWESQFYKWRNAAEKNLNFSIKEKRDWFISQITQEILKARNQVADQEIEGIGISWPGPIYRNQRLVGPNIDGFKFDQLTTEEIDSGGIDFEGLLNDGLLKIGLKTKISILNDADAAAYIAFGQNKIKNGILLILGTGIGAGIIKNGEIYFGPADFLSRMGEIGHHLLYDEVKRSYYYYGIISRGNILNKNGRQNMMDRLAGPGIARRFLKLLSFNFKYNIKKICNYLNAGWSGNPFEQTNLLAFYESATLPLKLEESILQSITLKGQDGDSLCKHFIGQIGAEIGSALSIFYRHFSDEPFIHHLKLAGSVGQLFGLNVLNAEGQDLFVEEIRKNVISSEPFS